jgi:hypothetical protein
MNWFRIRIALLILAMLLAAIGTFTYEHFLLTPPAPPPPTPTSGDLSDIFPPGYFEKVRKITTLLETAPTSQPSQADTNELFDEALHDSQYEIRIRAMAVFPFLDDRERTIDALISCVREHDPQTTGNGNVPLYAATYLAEMKATRAIPDIQAWIQYQQQSNPYGDRSGPIILKQSTKDLQRLQSFSTRPQHDASTLLW